MHERCPHSYKRKQLSLSVLQLHWFCTKAFHSRFLVLQLLPREGVIKYCSLKTTSLEGILYSASGSSNWFFLFPVSLKFNIWLSAWFAGYVLHWIELICVIYSFFCAVSNSGKLQRNNGMEICSMICSWSVNPFCARLKNSTLKAFNSPYVLVGSTSRCTNY